MTKLAYSEEELMAEHEYSAAHEEAGYRLHGGFDADGRYISPRTKVRWPAVKAWSQALEARGWPLIDASVRLLKRDSYPNVAQQKLLLGFGLGRTLWNSLTITGVIEGRGKAIVDLKAPDFQSIVVEDLAETATGHLNKGLLKAHGLDEGGGEGLPGAHDAMWFAVRDLVFGKDAYPLPEIPESIGRPEIGRLMPQIPRGHEEFILFLMNVLMIEVRAAKTFDFNCTVLRSPDVFTDRRKAAEHAAELVDRIRADEEVHVAYLQCVISELRSFTFKREDGTTVEGKEFIDPIWKGMIEWHAVTNPDNQKEVTREAITGQILKLPDGRDILSRFDALEARAAAAE